MISTLSKKHSFDVVFDSQKVYRLILEAMSNPAKTVDIGECADKLYGEDATFLAVAMTLFDNEVSFNTCDNGSLSDEIASLTHAKRETVEAADFVFVLDPGGIKTVMESVKCGTLSDPHKSATVIVQNRGENISRLIFSGPGIDGHRAAMSTEAVKEAIALRDAQSYEYPQGVDFIFVSESGELFAIPRLVRMEVE